jgi:hypothetical protein
VPDEELDPFDADDDDPHAGDTPRNRTLH